MNTNTALLTDKYELTMLEAALKDNTANKKVAFEVFNRRLPGSRRYGIVGGIGRLVEAVLNFSFNPQQLAYLATFLNPTTIEWLKNYSFTGNITSYREGEAYFPYSPILTVEGTFAETVVLETLILSILNHDTAIATAATRMKSSCGSKELLELGSRRTHEKSAIAAARMAYICGFGGTSNLAAGHEYNIPTEGTSAHAFTLLYSSPTHNGEIEAFQAQINAFGTNTTLLVDTFDINRGVENAIKVAGTDLYAIRIDSGDLGVLAKKVRTQLDDLGAKNTKIVVSGDLNEYTIAALKSEPIDCFGVGTTLVTGSGYPTAELVYKLVEVDGQPVNKRSDNKQYFGGKKLVTRITKQSGTFVEEIITPANYAQAGLIPTGYSSYNPARPLIVKGKLAVDNVSSLQEARKTLQDTLLFLPWEGLSLSQGDPAIRTKMIGF